MSTSLCYTRTYVSAGLPNITGQFTHTVTSTDWVTDRVAGAFLGSVRLSNKKNYSGSGYGSSVEANFSASNSNIIYGRSTTVTPKSYTAVFLIKY